MIDDASLSQDAVPPHPVWWLISITLADSVLFWCFSLPLVMPNDVVQNGHAADLSVCSLCCLAKHDHDINSCRYQQAVQCAAIPIQRQL